MSESNMLDQAMIDSLKDLLGEKFIELVSAFISDCSARLERMQDAVDAPDLSVIRSEAHGIKGSSRNIGANALGDICSIIETKAAKGDDSDLEQNLASAQQHFADVKAALSRMI